MATLIFSWSLSICESKCNKQPELRSRSRAGPLRTAVLYPLAQYTVPGRKLGGACVRRGGGNRASAHRLQGFRKGAWRRVCEEGWGDNRASAHRQDKDKRGVKRATSQHRTRSPHSKLRTKTCTTDKSNQTSTTNKMGKNPFNTKGA